MPANYSPPYIQENHLPFNPHGGSMSPKTVFAIVLETGFEVEVVLVCLFSVEAERSSKNPTYIRRPRCLSRQPRCSLIRVPGYMDM